MSQSLINQGNILTVAEKVGVDVVDGMSQSLINQGNILTCLCREMHRLHGKRRVAIPYKSGKYSYL